MRRLASILLAASLVFLGAEVALSALPHCHGNVADHTGHEGCPVHQLSLHGVEMDAAAAPALFFQAFACLLAFSAAIFVIPTFPVHCSTRAPPASL